MDSEWLGTVLEEGGVAFLRGQNYWCQVVSLWLEDHFTSPTCEGNETV